MEQTASNPRRRLIGKQPGPPEIFPEIDLVETFDKLHFPVKVKNRNLRMDSYPRLYAVLGIMWEQDIAVIEGQPRLTLQEAMKDAKKWAVKERQHQQQVAKELQELGQEVDEDDMIGEIEFSGGTSDLNRTSQAELRAQISKVLGKSEEVANEWTTQILSCERWSSETSSCCGGQWCAQVLVMSQFRTRLLQWTTLRGCNCDEGMPVAASGGHRSNLPQTAAEGTQRAAIWGCRGTKKKIDFNDFSRIFPLNLMKIHWVPEIADWKRSPYEVLSKFKRITHQHVCVLDFELYLVIPNCILSIAI